MRRGESSKCERWRNDGGRCEDGEELKTFSDFNNEFIYQLSLNVTMLAAQTK